jgi:O-antigen/teichoic acid export membrane protein
MILNVVLNLILIPKLAAVGAALASSISTIFLCMIDLWAVKKVLINNLKIWWPLTKALAAAILMVIFLILFKDNFPLFLTAILAALIYFVLLLLFGNLSRADWQFVKGSMLKR